MSREAARWGLGCLLATLIVLVAVWPPEGLVALGFGAVGTGVVLGSLRDLR